MKISRLIAILQKLPPDTPAYVLHRHEYGAVLDVKTDELFGYAIVAISSHPPSSSGEAQK